MPTDKIRALDMRLIDDLFGMGGGYVLDFSDRTFAEFFSDELDIDIDHPEFSVEGTSKAKRLRYFLRTSDSSTRVRVLKHYGSTVVLNNEGSVLRRKYQTPSPNSI